MNYYFSHFPQKAKNEATGLSNLKVFSNGVFILGCIQLWYAEEDRKNAGSSVFLPGPAPGGGVPCWDLSEESRGKGSSASLHCSVPDTWHPGVSLWSLSWYPVPPLFNCLVASGNDGALWGVTHRAPCEGKHHPTSVPGLCTPGAHTAICNVYLLASLLINVLRLRPKGTIGSLHLIGISMGQRMSLSGYMAGQGKEWKCPCSEQLYVTFKG